MSWPLFLGYLIHGYRGQQLWPAWNSNKQTSKSISTFTLSTHLISQSYPTIAQFIALLHFSLLLSFLPFICTASSLSTRPLTSRSHPTSCFSCQSERSPEVSVPPEGGAPGGGGPKPQAGLPLPGPRSAGLPPLRPVPGGSQGGARRGSGRPPRRAPEAAGGKPHGQEQSAEPGHQHQGGLRVVDEAVRWELWICFVCLFMGKSEAILTYISYMIHLHYYTNIDILCNMSINGNKSYYYDYFDIIMHILIYCINKSNKKLLWLLDIIIQILIYCTGYQ